MTGKYNKTGADRHLIRIYNYIMRQEPINPDVQWNVETMGFSSDPEVVESHRYLRKTPTQILDDMLLGYTGTVNFFNGRSPAMNKRVGKAYRNICRLLYAYKQANEVKECE